jgi:hypothetical protein
MWMRLEPWARLKPSKGGVRFALSKLWLTADITPAETRRRLITALILPKFLYLDVLYSQSSKGNRDPLNRAYRACARYVYYGVRIDEDFDPVKEIMGKPWINYMSLEYVHSCTISFQGLDLYICVRS